MGAMRRKHRALKKRRNFLNIFSVLLGLSLACACVFTFYMGNAILRSHNDQMMEMNLSRLVDTREEMDANINALSSYLWGNLWDPDVLDLMISLDLSDRPRNIRIVTNLGNMVDQYGLVSDALVYSAPLDHVILSSGFWMPLAEYENRGAVTDYLARRTALKDSSLLAYGRLFSHGKDLYLCFDQETPIYVGSLLFQLDMAQLAGPLNSGDAPVYVLDQEGNFVFAPAEAVDLTSPDLRFLEEGTLAGADLSDPDCLYYKTVSPVTGWTFLSPAQVGSLWDYLPDFLPQIIPFLLLYILVCAGLTYLLSKGLYQPIHTLLAVSTTYGNQKTALHWEDAQDEVSFLKSVYEKTLDDNQHFRSVLASVSQEVRDQVLYKLLVSRNVPGDYVHDSLASVGCEGLMNAQTMVLSLLLQFHESEMEKVVTWVTLRQMLVRTIQNSVPAPCQSSCYVMEGNNLAVVLLFPQEATSNRIRETVRTLQQEVAQVTSNTPATLFWGSSSVRVGLDNLNPAWDEAAQAALCRRYADDDRLSDEVVFSSEEMDEGYFLTLLRQALDMAAEGRATEVDETIRTLCQELEGREEASLMGRLHDAVVETLTLYGVESEDVAWLAGKWDDTALESFLRDGARLVQSNGRKNKFKYVDEAKAYVSRNYMNSDLSLNGVSEYIGISPTYLSTLFKEVTKDKFNSYLNTYRVEQAKILLRNTALSNADVGYRCGFNSNQSFYRVFKKVTNQTPSQYRDTIKKGEDQNG